MKRIISLVLSMVLIVACLAVPVMADETELPYLDLLDYGFPNNSSGTQILVYPDDVVSFSIPYSVTLGYVEILFTSNQLPSHIYCLDGSNVVGMTIESLGSTVYRAYCEMPRYWKDSVSFQFGFSEMSYVDFFKVLVWPSQFNSFDTTVSGTVNAMGLPNQLLYPSYPSSPYISWTYSSWDHYQGAYTDGMFTGTFRFAEWQKYDFCEMELNAIVKSISSVSAYLGDQIVPLEVSFIENAGSTPGNFYINIIADMRGFPRNTDDSLTININGIADFEMTNQISIFDAVGKILVADTSPWLVWFNLLQGWLSSGFSSVTSSLTSLGSSIAGYISDQTISITNSFTSLQSHITDRFNALRGWVSSGYLSVTTTIQTWGQNISGTITSGVDRIVSALSPSGSANDFNDKVQQQGSELENMAGAMGAVTRPDVSTAIPDISGYLTVTGPVTLAAVFDPFWKNSYILRLLLASLAVSVAFTVVYGGKK